MLAARMSAHPVASVVIPTYERAHLLPGLLRALEAQQGTGPFEVVIVDNGSTDDTPLVLRELAATASVPFRTVRLDENRGPSAARNAGWRAAHGPIIAFTDDDCLPQPDWLAALLARFEVADVVQGRTETDPDAGPIGPFGRTVIVRQEHGNYETCNLAYRRSLLEDLGGFDESYHRQTGGPVTWGDDTDLGWRARKAGARTAFADDAVVHHELRPSSFRRYVREIPRRDGLVLSLRRHPELRANYYGGYWFSAAHPRAVAVAAAAVGVAARPRSTARWVLAGAAAAEYSRATLAERHGPARRRHWVRQLPLAFVADLLEVGVFAQASVRYRTLFL